MLQNAYFLAKFDADTAKRKRATFCRTFAKNWQFKTARRVDADVQPEPHADDGVRGPEHSTQ